MEEKNIKSIEKKKLWLIILGSVLFVGVIVGIVLAFLFANNCDMPNKVEQKDNVYFYVDANNNYKGYRFKFENENQTLVFDSQSNIIYIDDLEGLIAGSKYQVSACYLSDSDSANSEYSEPITWTCYLRLDTPVLFIERDEISWQEVENASYYKVQIISSNGTIFKQTQFASFDLNDIAGGQYEIFVSAVSNQSYYIESALSEKLSVDFYKKFQPFVSASFNNENKILTIVGNQELNKIDIKIGITVYKDFVIKPVLEDDKYIYNVSLKDFFIDDDTFIGARPSSVDEFNVYEGEFTKATTK